MTQMIQLDRRLRRVPTQLADLDLPHVPDAPQSATGTLAPRHDRVWRRMRADCSCGLRWRTCPDRYAAVPTEPASLPAPANGERW
ncbi:hypothetical protein [Micromonospora sp. NPDC049497]|uniref:hypothetical protein n=1 Tax=Micromonospora sp. NPDC049497 TaxID=3364273 RepID=UPI00379070D1